MCSGPNMYNAAVTPTQKAEQDIPGLRTNSFVLGTGQDASHEQHKEYGLSHGKTMCDNAAMIKHNIAAIWPVTGWTNQYL